MIPKTAGQIEKEWSADPRWKGVQRGYSASRRRAPARQCARRAFAGAPRCARNSGARCRSSHYVNALGALTGNQAMQQVRAGLKAIYLSGWQVAGDANLAGEMYPDQSLYPADSVPAVVRRINNTLLARRPDLSRGGR